MKPECRTARKLEGQRPNRANSANYAISANPLLLGELDSKPFVFNGLEKMITHQAIQKKALSPKTSMGGWGYQMDNSPPRLPLSHSKQSNLDQENQSSAGVTKWIIPHHGPRKPLQTNPLKRTTARGGYDD
jgi:hypothetical protein